MRVACIGEGMVELASDGEGGYRRGFGGDTLNTAIYLARLGVGAAYVTALGDDPYSDEMLSRWQAEGIDCASVTRVPGRMPGLYMIERDERGERRFFYWRDRAPARDLMDHGDAVLEAALSACDWLYFSGITLSLYGEAGRAVFAALLGRLKARGVKLAFDGNYRPRGWTSAQAARAAFEAILPLIDIALPTFEDEQAVFGDAAPEATAARLHAMGVPDVAVKQGARGALVAGAWIAPPRPVPVVDTTAAGDSFNAAYLAARLRGATPRAAALAGHRLAGVVIQHPGAIIAPAAMPPFEESDTP